MCLLEKSKKRDRKGKNCPGSQNYFSEGKGTDNETELKRKERGKRNAQRE